MANEFKIKRGDGAPNNGSIENYELVYNYADNELWTMHGGQVVKVASGTTGTVTNVVAGNGLTGGGTSTATLDVGAGTGISVSSNAIAVSGLTVSEFAANSIQLSSESFADNNTSLMTSAAIADKIEAYGYSTVSGSVNTTGTVVDNDYAKFTDSNTVEGMSIAEMKLDLNYGTLADLDSVGASQITDNSVGAAELNVSGNGSVGHVLKSDGDGSFSWVSQTDTNTTYTAGTNLTLDGTEFDVDDAFLKNDANDTTSGTITAAGFTTSGNVTTDDYLQVNSNNATIKRYMSNWSTSSTHDVIYNHYLSNLGDYVYLKASGNSATGHGIAVVADVGFYVGDTNVEEGAMTNSATAPLTDTWAYINGSGNAWFKGSGEFSGKLKSTMTGGFTIGNAADEDRIQNLSNAFAFLTDGNAYANMAFATVTNGTWNGSVIASAYLDADTAHLSGSQTFSGVKTFSSSINLGGELNFTGNGNKIIDIETLENNNHLTIRHHNPIGNVFEDALKLTANAGAKLYYNNGLRFETTDAGVKLNDSIKLVLGTNNDLEIYHDDTNAVINNTKGDLQIYNNADNKDIVLLSDDASGGTTAYLTIDGGASLVSFDKATRHKDGKIAYFGTSTSSGLQIQRHTNGNSYIQNTNGNLYIDQTVDDADMVFRSDDGIGSTKTYFFLDGSAGNLNFNNNALVALGGIYGNGGNITLYNNTYNFKSATSADLMKLTTTGLGIGTTSPSYNLHVKSASGSHAEVRIETPSDSSVPALSLNNGNRVYSLGIMPDEDFAIRDGSDSWAERLSISTSGHVTIPNTLYCSKIQTDSGNLTLNGGGWGMNFYIDTDSNSADNYTFFSDGAIRHILGGDGNVTFGKVSNPTLSIMNTATAAGSGPTLEFGHDQGGGLRAAAIKTYLTDGSTTNRGAVLRFHHTQANADVLKLQLGDNYVRQYQKGDTSDYLETMVHDTHAEFHVAHGNYIKVSTDSGYALFGPQNSSWNHIYTDAAGHLFDKYVTALDGNFQSYSNVDLSLRRSQGSADRIDIAADYSRIIVNNTERFRATTSGATVTGQLTATTTIHSNQGFTTDYGIRFNNGATDFMFYNNTNDNLFYLRDLTNAEMLQTWTTNSTTIHKPLYVTGNIRTADGSAGAPAFRFTSDVDTGMYRKGEDSLGFSTNGNERVYITDAGIVVNGTSNFTGEMYIDHGGSDFAPGINFMGGTNTPGSNTYENAKLAYHDNSGTGYMRYIIGRNAGTHSFRIGGNEVFYVDAAGQGRFRGASDINMVVESTDSGGGIAIKDSNTSGDYYNGIYVSGNELFLKSNNSERVRVDSGGKVGINSDPPFQLKVNVDNGTYTDWETIAGFQAKRGADSETEAGIMINAIGDALGGQISSNWYWTDNTGAKGNTGRSAGIFGISNSTTTNSEFYWQNTAHNNTTLTTRMKIDNAHSLHVGADVVAYSTSVSDERFKDNIETIPNALDKVMQLRGVEFDWNKGSRKGTHDLGVVAQEVEKVLPELVKEKTLCTGEFTDNEKEFKTVDYDKIVAVLIEAVKEQQEEIELLKANYDDLKYNRR